MADPWLSLLGLVVFTLGALSDWYDGYLARKHDLITEFGKFIDPLADKVLTFAGFGILPFLNGDLFPWWAVGVIIFRDVAVTLLRIVAKRKHWPFATSKLAKWKTAVQLVYLYYILLLELATKVNHNLLNWSNSVMQAEFQYWVFVSVAVFTFWSGWKYFEGIYKYVKSSQSDGTNS
jgi:CDP-diacylglycerol--glycerol-3-phosphate 3-phosphatidyltransferase